MFILLIAIFFVFNPFLLVFFSISSFNILLIGILLTFWVTSLKDWTILTETHMLGHGSRVLIFV
jgi:hypothetical protein